ncbi:MAG: GntR family transcriptional regulator [Clostridiales bacterium]|nr:GntR family transcriptional regulator [Clostridiales bacterium]
MAEFFIDSATVTSRVIERLREDIISKRIETGSRITIKEIAERYNVSSMPVREAFRTLEGEKLLEINAYKGATVLTIDEMFVRDVYNLLKALELCIYESALRDVDEAFLARLRQMNDQIRALEDTQEDRMKYINLNTLFHDEIMKRATNSKAVGLYHYYHMLVRTLRRSYIPRIQRIRKGVREHDGILNALEEKDTYMLKLAVDRHIESAMVDFLGQYDESLGKARGE